MTKDLMKSDKAVLFFRASCDLGLAVAANRDPLSKVAGKKPLAPLLLRLSRNWLDSHIDTLADRDYAGHLELIRAQIEAAAKIEKGDREAAFRSILAELRPRDPDELTKTLQELCDQSFGEVEASLKTFADKEAVRNRWAERRKAKIEFYAIDPGPTKCSFRNGETDDLVIVHVGNHTKSDKHPQKGALRVFINLTWFFYHEYLSHSFSKTQLEEFVEGYLVWAALPMFRETTLDKVRVALAEQWLSSRESEDSDLSQRGRDVAFWFDGVTHFRFIPFLLEWATETDVPVDKETLEALHTVSERYRGKDPEVTELRGAFASGNVRQILEKIRDMARKTSNIPPYPPFKSRLQ